MDWIDPLDPGGLGVHESLLGNYEILLFKYNLCFLLKHNIGDCLVYLDVYSLCSIVTIVSSFGSWRPVGSNKRSPSDQNNLGTQNLIKAMDDGRLKN